MYPKRLQGIYSHIIVILNVNLVFTLFFLVILVFDCYNSKWILYLRGVLMTENLRFEISSDFNYEIEQRLSEIDEQLNVLDIELDKYTNQAERIDYIFAAVSGLIAGLIDIFFVGEFSLQEGYEWSSEKVNSFVEHVARLRGYEGEGLEGAIRHLEQYGAPSDSVYNKLGGAKQHHLRDFAHHASPIGLVFSLLTQFTKHAYGTNEHGVFMPPVPITDLTFIGETIPQKIIFGLFYWILHMASDMAGSSGSAGKGTGVPGPILSVVKLLSTLPIFNNENEVNELSLKVSKLFNGTLLAYRDENGKILKGLDGKPQIHKIDLRGELGVLHQLGKQTVPVLINEALVRGFYFINRLVDELKQNSSVKDIDWHKTVPFDNRTIERMITVSVGTFVAIDTADALIEGVIHSKGNMVELGRQTVLRLNFVGIGRFTVAIGTDVVMGMKKSRKLKEKMKLKNEALYLSGAKLYSGETLIWSAIKDVDVSVDSLYEALNKCTLRVYKDMATAQESISQIDNLDVTLLETKNKNLAEDILSIL